MRGLKIHPSPFPIKGARIHQYVVVVFSQGGRILLLPIFRTIWEQMVLSLLCNLETTGADCTQDVPATFIQLIFQSAAWLT